MEPEGNARAWEYDARGRFTGARLNAPGMVERTEQGNIQRGNGRGIKEDGE